MKILFWSEPYLGLYKEIQKELDSQGHQVVYIEEPKRAVSVYSRNFSLGRLIKKLYVIFSDYFRKYWEKQFIQDCRFNDTYDVFFCINGKSFHPVIIQHLKKYNPKLKTSLYIWDSNKTFDYFRNIEYFDNVFSFDLYDVNKYGKGRAKFMPFYWPKEIEQYDDEPPKYSVFSIGSLHDDRLFVYKKIIEQLTENKIPYFIKLVLTTGKIDNPTLIKNLIVRLTCKNKCFENYLVLSGQKSYPFITEQYFKPIEMIRIMSQSIAVLDTDLEKQGGVTPRLIWAMASNKLIFTTNKNIVKFPFYNPEYFQIIDRDKPLIDLTYLSKKTESRKAVISLRIDNWVKNFI